MSKRNRGVRERLRKMIVLTSAVALLLACVAFAAVDAVGSRRTLRADLMILADVIAWNSGPSLMFGDRESAFTVLSALAARPSIESASIYTKDGKLFSAFNTARDHPPPNISPPVGTVFGFDHIEVVRPVVMDQETIGTLYLIADLRELTARFKRYGFAVLVILLLSFVSAYVVSQPLQKKLADPILDLARVAGQIRSAKDYSVRAGQKPTGVSEIDTLTFAFNEMLGGIQTRDRELEERRANLEVEVEQRTIELLVANRELVEARDEARQVAAVNDSLARHKQGILNTAAEGIFGMDAHGVATFINPAAARMLGRSVPDMIGRPLHALIHEREQASLPIDQCALCGPAFGQESAGRSGTSSFVTADGRVFPIEYATNSIRDGDQHGGAVVTFRDITDRLAVEKMKDEFISTVSHELRTPLTSIRGALGLLDSGLLGSVDQRAQRMLRIAVTNTDRLGRLINDILDLERIRSGRVELHRTAVSVSELIRESLEVVQSVAERAGVSIVSEAPEALLLVDPHRIVQALTNLLGNAVKFSAAGKVVRIAGSVEGTQFVFSVADEGRGIPREKLEMIFERFKQVNASDSRDKGGTGLGLSICRSIVEAHGGRIWADSEERHGSTFTFSVPLALEGQARDRDQAACVMATAASAARPVLTVEDDPRPCGGRMEESTGAA
jgi:PAS domain S-box-containing protein